MAAYHHSLDALVREKEYVHGYRAAAPPVRRGAMVFSVPDLARVQDQAGVSLGWYTIGMKEILLAGFASGNVSIAGNTAQAAIHLLTRQPKMVSLFDERLVEACLQALVNTETHASACGNIAALLARASSMDSSVLERVKALQGLDLLS